MENSFEQKILFYSMYFETVVRAGITIVNLRLNRGIRPVKSVG